MRNHQKDVTPALFSIALGLICIIFRGGLLGMIGSAVAWIFILAGAVYLGSYFLRFMSGGRSIGTGLVLLTIGIWLLANPGIVVSVIPILIGLALIGNCIRAFRSALWRRSYGGSYLPGLLLAILSGILGIICITDAFGVMEHAMILIGLFLIYNGLSHLWHSFKDNGEGGPQDYSDGSYYHRGETIDATFVDDDK